MAIGFDVSRRKTVPYLLRHAGRRKARTIATVVGCCLLVSACGGFYTADEINATVVDADTKASIVGVNVIAEWVIQGGFNYGGVVGYLNVMETVTDQNGRFHFPSWGPRPNFHFGRVFQEAPTLTFFKPGYRYTVATNNGSVLAASPHRMTSDWNGQTVVMQRRLSPVLERSELYIPVVTQIESLWRFGEWSHIRRFLCALAPTRGSLPEYDAFWIDYSPQALQRRGVDCTQTRVDR